MSPQTVRSSSSTKLIHSLETVSLATAALLNSTDPVVIDKPNVGKLDTSLSLGAAYWMTETKASLFELSEVFQVENVCR